MGERKRRGTAGRAALGLLGCGLAILVVAAPAHGQGAADQYIPSPKPGDTGSNAADPGEVFGESSQNELPPPGKKQGSSKAGDPDAKSSSTDSGDDTTVPGTDFPISTFVAVVLAVIIAAVLAGLLVSRRRRRDSEAG